MGAKYQPLVDGFWEEHLHIDGEIRYILDGHGFEDVYPLKSYLTFSSVINKDDGYGAPFLRGISSLFHLDFTTVFILARTNSLTHYDGSTTCPNGRHFIRSTSLMKTSRLYYRAMEKV